MRDFAIGVMLGACALAAPALAAEPAPDAILKTYADIALAGYSDSLTTAKTLDTAVDALLANPTDATLEGGARRLCRRRASPTSRPRPTASATRSSTTGRRG